MSGNVQVSPTPGYLTAQPHATCYGVRETCTKTDTFLQHRATCEARKNQDILEI